MRLRVSLGVLAVLLIGVLMWLLRPHKLTESFAQPIFVQNGQTFGPKDAFAFSLYRNGTFYVDGKSGLAHQKSPSYRDSAFIRSAKPLPRTYKITAVVGEIDYDLEGLAGLTNDPEYPEGPLNENGVYLLTITDKLPQAPHTNIWWHQHRKVVIDVDNNIWGHGMPSPVFMVYFDRHNQLMALDEKKKSWHKQWTQALRYDKNAYYKVEIQKTRKEYILRVLTEDGKLLKQGKVPLKDVWNSDEAYPDYFALGDPHENYYQGSIKIKELTLQY